MTLPTASAMVDRLVKAGAVAPSTAAADRRRSELQLTANGQQLLQQIRGGTRSEFARALSRCSGDELQQLRAGLAVLERAYAPGLGA